MDLTSAQVRRGEKWRGFSLLAKQIPWATRMVILLLQQTSTLLNSLGRGEGGREGGGREGGGRGEGGREGYTCTGT